MDDQTANPTAVFASMAAMGTNGDWNEKGRDAGFSALVTRAIDYNVGFLRQFSSLHIIVLSDEDDHSTDISNGDWISWLQTEQGVRPDVTISSIVGQQLVNGVSEIGIQYIQATNQVGGVLWPVNNPDYDLALEQLGIADSGLARDIQMVQYAGELRTYQPVARSSSSTCPAGMAMICPLSSVWTSMASTAYALP